MTPADTKPDPISSNALGPQNSGVVDGFFTRVGGVSQGIYRGLNAGLGSGDDLDIVQENRRRIAAHFDVAPERFACPHQVHSADVVTVDAPFGDTRPKADAIVTATPSLVVGVLTADCGPVLFSDPKARIVGAAHAGWKGALAGILEQTIAAMEALGARRKNISAVLGPTISQQNYEVGPEFSERFVAADKNNSLWFRPSVNKHHQMFDLQGFIMKRLANCGIAATSLDLCTYADEERFFSYRRATHRGEPDYGRQISAIMLENE